MKGIDDAATRLADAIAAREKIVIVADYDADGATACAVAMRGLGALGADVDFLVPNRFEYGYGLTPEIVRAAGAHATAAPRHRRQRHREPRRRRGGGGARHRRADHRSPPAGGHAAGAGADRQSESAGLHVSLEASGRRRRDVLRAARDPRALRDAAGLRRAAGAEFRDAARSRRARHGRRRGAPRSREPHAGRAGTRPHPRGPGAAGNRRAVHRGRTRPAPRDGLRPGLRRRPAPQCRRTAGGHDRRHPLPAGGHRRGRAAARRRARPPQPRAARRRGDDAGRSAGRARRPRSGGDAAGSLHALPLPPRMASGCGRHRRVTAEGPLPSSRPRVCARRWCRRAAGAPAVRSPAFICATRSISSPSVRRECSSASAATHSPPA